MAGVDKNSIFSKQQRAEHVAYQPKQHGMGHDEAKERALEEMSEHPSSGGTHEAGDSHKPTPHESGHHSSGRKASEREAG